MYVLNGFGNQFEAMYRNVFFKELVYESSLVYREEGQNERAYGMHRLVCSFILCDMQRGSEVWNEMFDFALLSVHEQVVGVAKKDHSSMEFHDLVTHPLGLVDNFKVLQPGFDIRHVSKLQDVHQHVGPWLHVLRNFDEEVRVWRSLLAILRHQYQEHEVIDQLAKVHSSLDVALDRRGKDAEAAPMMETGLALRVISNCSNRRFWPRRV